MRRFAAIVLTFLTASALCLKARTEEPIPELDAVEICKRMQSDEGFWNRAYSGMKVSITGEVESVDYYPRIQTTEIVLRTRLLFATGHPCRVSIDCKGPVSDIKPGQKVQLTGTARQAGIFGPCLEDASVVRVFPVSPK